jgi:hypothetical protein
MSITEIPPVTLAKLRACLKEKCLELALILPLLLLAFAVPCGAQSLNTYKGKAADLLPKSVGDYEKEPFHTPGRTMGLGEERVKEYQDRFGLTDYFVTLYHAPNDKYLRLTVLVFKSPSGAKDAIDRFNSRYRESLEYTPPITPKKIRGVVVGERYATERKRRKKTGPPKADVVWTNGSVLFIVDNIPTPRTKERREGRVWSTDFKDLLSFESKFPY